MSNPLRRLATAARSLTRAVKSNWRESRIPNLVNASMLLERWGDGPRHTYFVTTDKGVFCCNSTGLYRILDIHLYGCAIVGERVFMGFYIDRNSIVVEGDASAMCSLGAPFRFQTVFSDFTSDLRERVHQITSHENAVWIAHTAAGAALRYDISAKKLTAYTLIRDRFGAPIRRDVNHINSVVQYGGVVLFTGTHAGEGSIIGVLDGTQVTGYSYKNIGVHDIYLTKSGFLFFDTFGPKRHDEGGVPVTENGVLWPEIFAKPPGYALRGAAQWGNEIVIGSSHKGERKQRFKGSGELLIFEGGHLRAAKPLPGAQIYQIITADGGTLEPPQQPPSVTEVHAMLQRVLGTPIYEGQALVEEITPER